MSVFEPTNFGSEKLTATSTDWVYRRIGVEPIINCTGTRTNYGGSNPSSNVMDAMLAASRHFVDLDELAEGAGAYIARLTGAQWGMVSAGSTAALALATAACIAGNDPEAMLRLPETGELSSDVIVIKSHRFPYDNAIRHMGGTIVEVTDQRELGNALSNRPAMICVLGRAEAAGFIGLENLRGQAPNIPIVVDAASLPPTSPDVWLARGADLVIYSGGKCIRGPQSTGFLIGRKDLCRAAWLNGPPHHAIGRGMKVGKEEIVGALTALEDWLSNGSRDTDKHYLILEVLVEQLHDVPITSKIDKPNGAVAPRLFLSWNSEITITGEHICQFAFDRHRVKLQDFWATDSSLLIDPFNIQSTAEAKTVGLSIAEAFRMASLGAINSQKIPEAHANLSGKWQVNLSFLSVQALHTFQLTQLSDGAIEGFHHGRFGSSSIVGRISGVDVTLSSRSEDDPTNIYFQFHGLIEGNLLVGTVSTGAAPREFAARSFCSQFGTGTWTAFRI
ncbi:seryl-tRNA(Sec) selenium transferase [Bradyrhizobium sp. IAR9]|uniref:hypothetical protein n=1 Tax=Bradyrhizobium sp. IAR9 TaxID=2663841 RepID=UPI0015C74B3B|nr:hypothetical protein [Bradyrhizobium sp. IAR9]NYG45464.1 seryl-tRNA(Sec) selenium transferase [Bradyrhizobium sp. IAR9]